jgi:hypothetical protein
MAYGSVNADLMTTSDGVSSSGLYGFKNRIINGAMVISQRGTSSVTITDTGALTYTLDRMGAYGSVTSKFSVQQNAGSVTPPTGFTNYLGVTSLSAYSIGSGDLFKIQQSIEGYNIADLGWGTANAKTVTLSFWVRSSLTGTFGGAFVNNAFNRNYPFTYTISSANTWEQKSVTIAGDTTGTWESTTSTGVQVIYGLGMGSTYSGTAGAWATGNIQSATGATSVVGTNGATFYITGVQLEKGSTATSFDYRPYGTELALCQRYFQIIGGVSNGFPLIQSYSGTTDNRDFPISFPVKMRTTPTGTKNGTWDVSGCGQPSTRFLSSDGFSFGVVPTANNVNFYAYPSSTDDTLTFSAEL